MAVAINAHVFCFPPVKSVRLDSHRRSNGYRPIISCFSRLCSSASSTFRFADAAATSTNFPKFRRDSLTSPSAAAASAMLVPGNPVLSDICATAVSALAALSGLRFWEETAKHDLFDRKLNRKLMHISIGVIFMLCWPLFSSGPRRAILASITPGINIIRMILVGSGIWKDEDTMKSMSRYGDRRELLKGPLSYATTITLASLIYWRTSPIAIAAICNLCAGDGFADVVEDG